MSTGIEWTDETWNPITGCTLVSEGCNNCYAAELAAGRLKNHPSRKGLAVRNKAGVAKFTGEVRFNEPWLTQPLRWNRPRMIFVVAHGDLFHPSVPVEWIDQIFAVMALCPQHTFQVLTKRPARMLEYLLRPNGDLSISAWCDYLAEEHELFDPLARRRTDSRAKCLDVTNTDWPLPNLWLGISAEHHTHFVTRAAHLLATPAAKRFISFEPLLGPIRNEDQMLDRIDWAICGGESGPANSMVRDIRPMQPYWARSLRDQCAEADTPFFFKQWGNWAISPDRMNYTEGATWAETTMKAKHTMQLSSGHTAAYVPKKRAGRLLDGREHNAMPEVK